MTVRNCQGLWKEFRLRSRCERRFQYWLLERLPLQPILKRTSMSDKDSNEYYVGLNSNNDVNEKVPQNGWNFNSFKEKVSRYKLKLLLK